MSFIEISIELNSDPTLYKVKNGVSGFQFRPGLAAYFRIRTRANHAKPHLVDELR